ncbi:MAG: hypothetical protein WBW33_21470 [Bryobacteraceae bacterium]
MVPSTVRTRDLNRDTSETEWVTTFSDCREASEKVPEQSLPALCPRTWAVTFKLAQVTPIDTSTAAAGDVIGARLAETMLGPSSKTQAPAGATLTGRIMRMEHHLQRLEYTDPTAHVVATGGRSFFVIWMDFDTIEANGVVWAIRARLTCGQALDRQHRCPFATMSDQTWDRAIPFGSDSADANIVVPAGYTSTWLTGDPNSKQQ